MKKNVSIVIIHYKALDHLKKCLERLHSSQHLFDITVVDNNSQLPLNRVKKLFPNVHWIENNRNRGFAFAANQGTLAAHGRWILFLNPDVFMTSSEVEGLFHFAEKENLDAVSPTFSDDSYRKPLPTFGSLLSEFSPFHTISYQDLNKKTLVGGCVLVKKKVLEKLSGWDERFFLWFEDSDLTQRLSDSGYRYGFVPFEVKHIGGSSVNQLKEYVKKQTFFHSLAIYAHKHFPDWQQYLISRIIIDRFVSKHGYPFFNQGSSWVVPNMRIELLHDFLSSNAHFFVQDELIIVSSKLSSENVWKFRKAYPQVRFIPIENNRGFASTVNIGFRLSTTQTVGTVNDDVILNTETLTHLSSAFRPEIGSLNPIIYTMVELIESAGVEVLKKGKALPITHLPTSDVSVVPATNAACVLYNTEALEQVGLFDEKFGSYLEDIDLSLRLRRQGYLNVVVKRARVIHAKHSTSKLLGRYKRYLDLKNWWLVVLKNWSISEVIQYFPFIVLERLRNISGLIKN